MLALAVSALLSGLVCHAAIARDASRPAGPATQTSPQAIPNPYAAPAKADRAGDAYATGFAIGLGNALVHKQREDELKRQQK
jgi:hypothetical protein